MIGAAGPIQRRRKVCCGAPIGVGVSAVLDASSLDSSDDFLGCVCCVVLYVVVWLEESY